MAAATLSPLLLKAVLTARPRDHMETLTAATAVEAMSIEVDFEEGMALGENADLQVGHIRPDIQDDEMTSKVVDDSSKREGDGRRRTRLRP